MAEKERTEILEPTSALSVHESTIFVTSLSCDQVVSADAYSEAANQVQTEIMVDIAEDLGPGKLSTISMTPVPAFPRGPLIIRGSRRDQVRYIGFLNLPILKHLAFSVHVLLILLTVRPGNVVVYNSYFFQNLALLLYKFLRRKIKVAVFVQDILPVGGGMRSIQRYIDRYSLRFLSKFDLVLPISEHIIADFNITAPSIVIKGGLTRNIIRAFLLPRAAGTKKKQAVFAGGLEPHNGIDRLLNAWVSQTINIELHVFGKGSLSPLVSEIAKTNSSVIFYGFAPHEQIQNFIASSEYLFVLRYDVGIESKYFFPSKFWEAVASEATVICNCFSGFPSDLKEYCLTVQDDLVDLGSIISAPAGGILRERNLMRRDYVIENYAWTPLVRRMLCALR
jgi:hypothetical protein